MRYLELESESIFRRLKEARSKSVQILTKSLDLDRHVLAGEGAFSLL